ncbi:RHS repeat-associated core domain-containing protein [Niallia sp. 03133]|uniref:RHS repeat-associated core domain-containing protein n=1 Tax=Niallia sp. 03133 TaxID=3458060 RepID=UPI0040450D77
MVVKDKNASGAWQTKTYYFWTNQRGDVTSIVDSTGVEVGSYTYDAYGNVLSENSTIAKENSIRYASYYYDQETKHYYLKARYYDPLNGNFLALDPHPGDDDDPISQNGYMYAGNNPVLQVDPDGDFFWLAVNLGVSAYYGYKAYKKGGWKAAAVAAGVGLVGGAAFKAGRVAYRAYKARKVYKIAKSMKFDSTANRHMGETGRYVPRYLQARAIVYGKKTKDGAKGYSKYTTNMYKNNKKYKLEVVYNKKRKAVRHFLYRR